MITCKYKTHPLGVQMCG